MPMQTASGQRPEQKTGSNDQKAAATPITPAQKQIEAKSYTNPCGYPKTHEGSDLCAQWTAATAARDSAYWQGRGFPWDVGAAAAGVVTVLLSLAAAIQASRSFRSQKRTE